MRTFLFPALCAGLSLCFAAACSSNSGSGASGSGATSSGSGGQSTCPGDLAAAPGSDFCTWDSSTIDCALVSPSDREQVCGVPLPSPTTALTRSTSVMEFAGSGPPDLGCFQASGYPTAGTSAMVTMSGVAKIFAHGCASTGLTIEVHTVNADASIGALVGTAVTTPATCTTNSVAVTDTNCGTIYECNYTYPDVPSETQLIVLTKGAMWAPLYDYNNYIPTADVKAGVWTHDVRALASDDYGAIAQSALGAPITAGNGAIAGEVHDCGDVRLIGATADTDVARKQLTYFTSDESDPLPNSSATATTALGLYAALDIAPGPATVAALGLVGGQVTTLGYVKVQVYPDSVTSLTFNGVKPYQLKP